MNDIHAGDRALKPILDALAAAYAAPRERCEEILKGYLKPKLRALQPREGEKAAAYQRRVMTAFTGPRWALVKRKIALLFAGAHEAIVDQVNGALEQAFADGFNDAAFYLARSGVEMWPMTLSIVAALFTLNRRTMKKREDLKYNEQCVQSAIMAAIARKTKIEGMAKEVAGRMARARQREMTTYARAAIYGASDKGAYMAGVEAENLGIDVEKTWLAIMDIYVRPSHSGLHGDTIRLHEKFHGLYGDLMYPHDPEAPPQEVCNCRCRMVVHVAGKSPGEYSRFLLPIETLAYRKWRDKQIMELGGELELLKKHKKLVA